jgi:hypothetical protein
MPKYTPIETPLPIKASLSDVLDFHWTNRGEITIDFLIPGNENEALRVKFKTADVVRLLDEMPLSTEPEATKNEGCIPEHFAYSVEEALFSSSQSAVLKTIHSSLKHYRFITGWTCVDVLSQTSPAFLVVRRPAMAKRIIVGGLVVWPGDSPDGSSENDP